MPDGRTPASDARNPASRDRVVWDWDPGAPIPALARNVGTRYLGIAVEAILGLLVLPFNVRHLGPSAYGLWMLVASVTLYFSVLDLGYGGALVKFVAQYRARRDSAAINEILSTLFFVFAGVGIVTYAVAAVIAFHLPSLFHLAPEQARVGRDVLLIVTAHVSLGFAFSVFGGVINGFQRYHLNNVVGAVAAALAAAVNVLVLGAGCGLVAVVAATTAVRILALFIYRLNAYRVFPALRIRPRLFRAARLREVTSFSVFMLLLDWANKVNYSVDAIVIGAFLDTVAVAVWTVAQRLAEMTQRLTNQLNDILFPAIVDSDESRRQDRIRRIFLSATRLSLATVLPVAGSLCLLAHPLVFAWVGAEFAASVRITQLLAIIVAIRVGNATATTVLKGAGRHRLLAACNLAAAGSNLLLSVLLVRPLGLVGVALGTLIPISVAAVFVLFPAACRRAGVSVPAAVGAAIWPAAWPALVMTGWLLVSRGWLAVTLAGVMADAALGALLYLAIFVGLAMPADERRLCLELAQKWSAGRQSRFQTAA
jgi:O-antigen/teichoic acid export membrane protein